MNIITIRLPHGTYILDKAKICFVKMTNLSIEFFTLTGNIRMDFSSKEKCISMLDKVMKYLESHRKGNLLL